MQQNATAATAGLRPGPRCRGAYSVPQTSYLVLRGPICGGEGEGVKRMKKKGGDRSLGRVRGRRRRERKEIRERGRGGEGNWNRAADWLRPVLLNNMLSNTSIDIVLTAKSNLNIT